MNLTRLGVGAVGLIIGIGLGVAIGLGVRSDPCLTAGDHILDVGVNNTVSCFKAKIKRGKPHRVRWESPVGTTLSVRFGPTVPQSVPQPTCGTPHPPNACVLGPIAATVPPSPADGYPYTVKVTGSAATSTAYSTSPTPPQPNGRIIIQK
jgi:hypothetical protein